MRVDGSENVLPIGLQMLGSIVSDGSDDACTSIATAMHDLTQHDKQG